ncbi:cbb3-type cytochrome oxidase assembly protein CcoS [Massilibacterium senegalense]|uniref:cbb3-type cytochrome oxidase assembly protein CcoS n=1 Tax=Massilibacterium senegalense TaxID=1632858 RepID=UPI00078543D9|nr:cbb3-type cytochrome oxidase assembly protein CcoS [Massilibacterium senegalense]
MNIGAWTLIIVLISFSGSAILIYLLGKKLGQFDDVEGIKYRMLEDDDEIVKDDDSDKKES